VAPLAIESKLGIERGAKPQAGQVHAELFECATHSIKFGLSVDIDCRNYSIDQLLFD